MKTKELGFLGTAEPSSIMVNLVCNWEVQKHLLYFSTGELKPLSPPPNRGTQDSPTSAPVSGRSIGKAGLGRATLHKAASACFRLIAALMQKEHTYVPCACWLWCRHRAILFGGSRTQVWSTEVAPAVVFNQGCCHIQQSGWGGARTLKSW